jgi:hypothetical protein
MLGGEPQVKPGVWRPEMWAQDPAHWTNRSISKNKSDKEPAEERTEGRDFRQDINSRDLRIRYSKEENRREGELRMAVKKRTG